MCTALWRPQFMQQVRAGIHTHKGGTEIRVAVWLSCGHPAGHLPDMRRILLLLISLFVYSVAEKGFQSYKQREQCADVEGKCIHQRRQMKIGTRTEADKEDSEADPLAGFISGSYCFLPLAPFSARVIVLEDWRQLGLVRQEISPSFPLLRDSIWGRWRRERCYTKGNQNLPMGLGTVESKWGAQGKKEGSRAVEKVQETCIPSGADRGRWWPRLMHTCSIKLGYFNSTVSFNFSLWCSCSWVPYSPCSGLLLVSVLHKFSVPICWHNLWKWEGENIGAKHD